MVVAVGSVLQGAVGFGANLLAAPLLVLIEPDLVPGPLLIGAFALNLLMMLREHAHGDWHEVGWAMAGRVPGTVLGAAALVIVSSQALGLWFGTLLLVAVGLSAARIRFRPTRPALVGAGTFSGFMATTVGVGGPPIALVYQHATGPVLRATLAQFFVLGAVLSVAVLTAFGEMSTEQFLAGVALMPGFAAGFLVSIRVARWLDRGWTRVAVLAVSAASAAAVLVKEVAT